MASFTKVSGVRQDFDWEIVSAAASNNFTGSGENSKAIQVSAGLIFRGGKLLITQRRLQDHLGGLWEFPGGKQNVGESPEVCLKRELREELDIEVTVHELVEEITHRYPEKTVCLKFFRCDWLQNEPRPLGCQNLAWVARTQLGDYEFPAADAQLIVRIRNTPSLWTTD